MRMVAALVLVASTAYAQPGAPQQPPPPPPGYPPPPYQYQPGVAYPAQLSAEDHDLLMEGEISDGAHFGGGVASLFLGFGSGQAIQGRWDDTGWIFTLGEAGSVVAMISGAVRTFEDCDRPDNVTENCNHSDGPPLMVVGLIGFTVFRVWEIVDAFGGPSEHNRRVRALKYRLGIPVQVGHRVTPYMVKNTDGGGTAGLSLTF